MPVAGTRNFVILEDSSALEYRSRCTASLYRRTGDGKLPEESRWSACSVNGNLRECGYSAARDKFTSVTPDDQLIVKAQADGACGTLHARQDAAGYWLTTDTQVTPEYGGISIHYFGPDGKLLHSGNGFEYMMEGEEKLSRGCCTPRNYNDVTSVMWEDPESRTIRAIAVDNRIRAMKWGTWQVEDTGDTGVIAAMTNPDREVRKAAVWIAAVLGGRAFESALRSVLRDPNNDEGIRAFAHIGLARAGDDRSASLMFERLRTWRDASLLCASTEPAITDEVRELMQTTVAYLPPVPKKDSYEMYQCALGGWLSESALVALSLRTSNGCDAGQHGRECPRALAEPFAAAVLTACTRLDGRTQDCTRYFRVVRHKESVPFLKNLLNGEGDCRTRQQISGAIQFQENGKPPPEVDLNCQDAPTS